MVGQRKDGQEEAGNKEGEQEEERKEARRDGKEGEEICI